MEQFTASNGVTVLKLERGLGFKNVQDVVIETVGGAGVSRYGISQQKVDALREFYRAEEDERLGRWRWARDVSFVVYPWVTDPARRGARGVTVLCERIPRFYTVWEDNVDVLYGDSADASARQSAREAARAFFDAHPEPEPWHDAQPGEVWILDLVGSGEKAWIAADSQFFLPTGDTSGAYRPLTDPCFRSGRRIYPEAGEQ